MFFFSRRFGNRTLAFMAIKDKEHLVCRKVSKKVPVPPSEPGGACFRDMAKILVGPEEREFLVHKGLLCHYSDYFRGALNGAFKEGIEGVVSMPQEDPYLFEVFVSLCYTRKLQDMADKAGADMEYLVLIDLWVFGDKHMIPTLQNAAMDALLQKNAVLRHVPSCHIQHIYDNTVSGAQIRQVVIDLVAYTGGLDDYVKCTKDEGYRHEEAWGDLVKVLDKREKKARDMWDLPARSKCHYHVHDDGERCK